MLIDTHCHLNFEAFKNDYQAVVKRCQEKGMKMVTVGSQMETSQRAVALAHEFSEVFAAVGLHPTHLDEFDFVHEEYHKLGEDPKTVAIGETGLDYYQMWADTKEEENKAKEKQREMLRNHLILAREVKKPVILHCRDAYEDLIAVLAKESDFKAVVHCFLGSREIAKKFLDLGCFLGFTGIITFTEDSELFEVVKATPLEKIFIETDAPYLAPQAYRGKRCEPWHVEEVAKKIAALKNLTVDQVIAQTGQNAQEFFNI